MSANNIEVGVVREDKKFQVLTPQQIKEYLDELNWCWIDHYCKTIYKIINKILKILKLWFPQLGDW